jgi:hypothetical protein
MYYRENRYAGCSYAIEKKEEVKAIAGYKRDNTYTKEELNKVIQYEH